MRRRSQWLARRLVQLRAETGRELQGASASACCAGEGIPVSTLGGLTWHTGGRPAPKKTGQSREQWSWRAAVNGKGSLGSPIARFQGGHSWAWSRIVVTEGGTCLVQRDTRQQGSQARTHGVLHSLWPGPGMGWSSLSDDACQPAEGTKGVQAGCLAWLGFFWPSSRIWNWPQFPQLSNKGPAGAHEGCNAKGTKNRSRRKHSPAVQCTPRGNASAPGHSGAVGDRVQD